MAIPALLERIRLGEDSYLELKEVRFEGGRITAPHRTSLADEMAALANSRGGLCVLGVSDSREVKGIPIERLDDVERLVHEVCTSSIIPPLMPVIERVSLETTEGPLAVLKVEVPRSLFVHRSPGGYFYRVGSSKREMSPDHLARLFQQRSQTRIIRFDEQTVPGAVLEDLDEGLWRRFYGASQDEDAVFLNKLGLANADADGVERPSVAGVLMACQDPTRFLPNAFIQAVSYRGTEVVPNPGEYYQIDSEDIVGPLDEQVVKACHFVKKNMKVAAIKDQGRFDLPQYDLHAVFEALVNAVAHRDYSIYGAKIRLRMFADRLEIYSPGAIPNTMTVDSLPFRQSARNETITSLLARCEVPSRAQDFTSRSAMMDKRGEGVQVIIQRTQKLAGKPPEFRMVDDSELVLVIPAASFEGRV